MKYNTLLDNITYTVDEQKHIILNSESLSEASFKLMGLKSTLGRTIIKDLCEKYQINLPHKQEKITNKCLNCGKEIKSSSKFCSHSCAASFNNSIRFKKVKKCKYCGSPIEGRKTFCDSECFKKFRKEKSINEWKSGERKSEYTSDFIREFLFKKNNNKCEKCGWSEVNPYTGKIPLQVHHIDGDCTNNSEENLQLLCPNCHSLTENFGSKNKGFSRRTKRQEKRKMRV